MNNLLKRKLHYVFIFILFLYSCDNKHDVEKSEKRVTINYKNGSIYCDGFYSVIKATGLPINSVGIWKTYYPNGKIESMLQYNNDGEIINKKNYSENGTMTYLEVVTVNITNPISYFDNGKIEYESSLKTVTETNDEDENGTTYETFRDYYLTGQLYSEESYENGILEGTKNIWDTSGNKVLSVDYKKGILFQK